MENLPLLRTDPPPSSSLPARHRRRLSAFVVVSLLLAMTIFRSISGGFCWVNDYDDAAPYVTSLSLSSSASSSSSYDASRWRRRAEGMTIFPSRSSIMGDDDDDDDVLQQHQKSFTLSYKFLQSLRGGANTNASENARDPSLSKSVITTKRSANSAVVVDGDNDSSTQAASPPAKKIRQNEDPDGPSAPPTNETMTTMTTDKKQSGGLFSWTTANISTFSWITSNKTKSVFDTPSTVIGPLFGSSSSSSSHSAGSKKNGSSLTEARGGGGDDKRKESEDEVVEVIEKYEEGQAEKGGGALVADSKNDTGGAAVAANNSSIESSSSSSSKDAQPEQQLNETIVWEANGELFRLNQTKWLKRGRGPFSIHQGDGYARIQMIEERTKKQILNTPLHGKFDVLPTANGEGAVFTAPNFEKPLPEAIKDMDTKTADTWALSLKDKGLVKKLSHSIMKTKEILNLEEDDGGVVKHSFQK